MRSAPASTFETASVALTLLGTQLGRRGRDDTRRDRVALVIGVVVNAVPARSRRFPDELLTPVEMAEVPEEARVELDYRDNEVIEGTACGKKVRLAGRVGSHRGLLRGSWGDVPVGWRIGDACPVPAILTGHLGDDAVKLNGDFRLAPNYFFEDADIVGALGATPFRAVVSAAAGGLGSTSTIVAEGTVGRRPLNCTPLSRVIWPRPSSEARLTGGPSPLTPVATTRAVLSNYRGHTRDSPLFSP